MSMPRHNVSGRASLVGAGPGDPELLTVKALRRIESADVLLYDKLVDPRILDLAPAHARRIDVGKRCGRHEMSQAAINRLIVAHAQAGAHVVRLKGGDPMVFGRAGEELAALAAAGVVAEVVPGITVACAAAASMAMPLTQRGYSRSLHLITGHGADEVLPAHDWNALAACDGTIAIYMGGRTLAQVTQRLLAAGLDPATPAIAIENATLEAERRLPGTVADIAARVAAAAVMGPTLVLVGRVVALRRQDAVESAMNEVRSRAA
ncbi:uroporphyrinogen-III C-methyltransferase [Nitrospirillum sp. BR 11164]|uniref:uroporphyrinogen-III C-methyltransferase n=1 Tax=Nitrospirillum sp. BR 11164 TaxID=3104324 RepID=UPI002AFE952E|nr:uroporphyrinogen-III C-methyltransferase [Nitrospirillum sp. BR 11164]MEA1652724.1 uroporphyrinogen-III C-methyltransferase [Nitrospirillum sp. BR 11164]